MQEIVTTAIKTAAKDSSLIKDIYKDTLQPATKNLGQALGTLSSTLNVLLAPFSWAVYGFNQIDSLVKSKLEEKLSNTPLENLREPEPNIVIPAYEALRYTLDKENLREMYINLISNSMKIDTANYVHPAFVEVIKQFSFFDAELLEKLFGTSFTPIPKVKVRIQKSQYDNTGFDLYDSIISNNFYDFHYTIKYNISLDNLERLKIIKVHDNNQLLNENEYESIINNFNIDLHQKMFPDLSYVNLIKGSISLTNFGRELVSNIF